MKYTDIKYIVIAFSFMISVMTNNQASADEYVPLLEADKEWAYAEYILKPEVNPNAYIRFYRMALLDTVTVNGVEYSTVTTTNLFSPYKDVKTALMREENGKVYVRYLDDENVYPTNYFTPGEEHFLYDVSMQVGDMVALDIRDCDNEEIVLKCIEAGDIDLGKIGKRKYIRLDRNVNETTRRWMPFEYIIEGIGPIGNCTLIAPYCECADVQDDTDFVNIDFLYQRTLLTPGEDFETPQGSMIYKTPLFDVMGPYDPSVWHWRTAPESNYASMPDVPSPDLMPDNNISITREDVCHLKVVSAVDSIEDVSIFDILGNLQICYKVNSNELNIDISHIDSNIIILRTKTANGARTFKLNV